MDYFREELLRFAPLFPYATLFRSAPPATTENFDGILADFDRLIMPATTHWNHPGFMAYFATTGSAPGDRKSTRLNSSHSQISYAVFRLKKKKILHMQPILPRGSPV